MPDREVDRILQPFVEARFTCARCGRDAAHLTLFGRGLAEPLTGSPPIGAGAFPTLVIEAGRMSTRIGTASLGSEAFVRALAEADPEALHAVDVEFAPFWCPACGATYCADEWTLEEVWDSEFPEFWEELRGVCPAGHARTIYD
jgi:hypothetical protein